MLDEYIVEQTPDVTEVLRGLIMIFIVIFCFVYIAVALVFLFLGQSDYFGLAVSLAGIITFIFMLFRAARYRLNEEIMKNPRLRRARYAIWFAVPFLLYFIAISFTSHDIQSQIGSVAVYNLFIVLFIIYRNIRRARAANSQR